MTLLNSAGDIVGSARADISAKRRIMEQPRLFCDKPGEKAKEFLELG